MKNKISYLKYNWINSYYLYAFLTIWQGFAFFAYSRGDSATGNILSGVSIILFVVNAILDYKGYKKLNE